MELLIPSWGELAGWGGVLVATLLFIGLGRLVSAGRAAPEVALVAGWGAACLLLMLWGIVSPVSLLWPAAVVALLGLLGHVLPRSALAPVFAAPRFALFAVAESGGLDAPKDAR